MKTTIIFVIIFFATVSFASPVYYTFNGTVTYVNDEAGLAMENNVSVGTEFYVTFEIDTDLPGTETEYSNYPFHDRYYTWTKTDQTYPSGVSVHYFYTDLMTRPLLQGSLLKDMGTSEKNYGSEQIDPALGINTWSLYGSNSPHTTGDETVLSTQYVDLADIEIGKRFNFSEIAFAEIDSEICRTTIYATGTTDLVDVSDTLNTCLLNDFTHDGDVDGADLAHLATTVFVDNDCAEFAFDFGKGNCF
jgi:hypothetical protein